MPGTAVISLIEVGHSELGFVRTVVVVFIWLYVDFTGVVSTGWLCEDRRYHQEVGFFTCAHHWEILLDGLRPIRTNGFYLRVYINFSGRTSMVTGLLALPNKAYKRERNAFCN